MSALTAAAARTPASRTVKAFFGRRDIQLIPVMLLIVLASALANHQFASSRVISNIFIAAMVTTFVALGETFVMLTKGIDLSVAPILGLSAVIVGFQAQDHGLPLPLGILLGAGIGAVLGVGNGVLVSLLGLPPIIATLGTFSIYGGLQYITTGGSQVTQIPTQYTQYGVATDTILPGIPVILIGGILATLIVGAVLRHTVFGRNLYATGDDYEGAFRAGIPTRRVTFFAYVICGLLAGIAGVVYLTRTGSADALTGTQTNENLNAIAAALIGGAALTGGRGTATGALFGSVFLSLTLSAMGIAAHIPDEWQPAGIGALILLAVVADSRARSGGALEMFLANFKRRVRR